MAGHLAYLLAWIVFGATHSGLAHPRAKALLGRRLGRSYRIAYNLVAVAQFGLVAWVGAAALGDRPAFALPAAAKVALGAVHVAGWLALLWSARFYDLARLGGTAQLRGLPEDEELRLDGPHRFVRHPLYAAGFLILWGAALSPLGLATALWGSLYLLLGTWSEERKLIALYGEPYAAYRRRVPAYIPWKGRAI